MAFLEDPRLRQRWNQIAHDAEAVTENAAAGIWSFQHNYINPCLGSIAHSIEQCTALCLGDPEDRLRRRRERERARGGAEFSFDFYDDWYEEEQGSGLLGSWRGEDWDRLLAGTGSQQRKHAGGETAEQPRRKRGMSYGTRGSRRTTSEQDPTIIPSTQPIGFLSKLPWKLGGTLRYKPSAADLQDRPRQHDSAESQPLLAPDDDGSDYGELPVPRHRSGTACSGDTSDSYRSRGDLFPSDGEGEEDAVPLDDDVTYDMVRIDDRSSGKSGRTRSSKGKRREPGFSGSRTVSRTTLGSATSAESLQLDRASRPLPSTPDAENAPLPEGLGAEGERLQLDGGRESAMMKEAATLSASRGLEAQDSAIQLALEPKPEVAEGDMRGPVQNEAHADHGGHTPDDFATSAQDQRPGETMFQAARLPSFD